MELWERAAASVSAACRVRDQAVVEEIYAEWARVLPNPRGILGRCSAEATVALRTFFEAWDDVTTLWWYADDEPEHLWRTLCAPQPDGLIFNLVALNAWWLRLSGSSRVCDTSLPTPAVLASLPIDRQARLLGRFCGRADAGIDVAYQAVAEALDPLLRPYFARWFLAVYLMSPFAQVDAAVNARRASAAREFAAFHDDNEVDIPTSAVLGMVGYRAAYFTNHPRSFVSTLASRVLAPSFRCRITTAMSESPKGGGVLLTCWRENHAVYRCMSPLLAHARSRLRSYVVSTDGQAALDALPTAWRRTNQTVHAGAALDELAAAASVVRGDGLDFLFFPEVGLTLPSRWLSCARLARVQAAGFGHPVTTGSDCVDFFVLGEEVARGRYFREQLVLMPGLGVVSTPPPAPSKPRQRPVDAQPVRFISMASRDKLNEAQLRVWDAILAASPHGSTLVLLPSVHPGEKERFEVELRKYLRHRELEVYAECPRQACIDLLNEADVYLDSFPYGGYNTIVEALAVECPAISLEGESAVERHGAAALRVAGLPDVLAPKTAEGYVDIAVKLATDVAYRTDIRALCSRERMLERLCSGDVAHHFSAAVEWMIRRGPGRRGPPVLIRAGEPPQQREDLE